ncbi:Pkinase-domain-containing protein [Aaosphaeria arxii CBS 175.79]|uniref:non-specific serine/threonine protein kinase n=1 Tax=Aaosphaeria arxii CBS 175.79 TaxID=1450172 RepID=A0A6A5XXC8_9PLEO|nr:Pkinase-domain-containing protein [Aaosphaeria arxii CBS 175.79]KAF2017300.1 Pkinase-domain-containing protein [Aaosphaeria arxii CBS 175.79]
MDHVYHGRPPTRRQVLGDASSRANEDKSSHARRSVKGGLEGSATSSPVRLPHNESLEPNGSLAVRHPPEPSPENKRLSAVINDGARPHNPKRDSEISNASTNASGTSRRRKTCIGPWELGKTVGRGGCSRVRIVRHMGTGEYGAAKIISKATAEKVRALSLANLIASAETDPTLAAGKLIPFGLEREICIMKLLDHPNIVRLHDVWENRNELYLIMEYVQGGELFGYIGEQGRLQEVDVVHLFRQIIAALMYCHRLNIHHRDLKPENILLDRETATIKLVDFGMAALQPAGKKLTTPCGSPHYAAPEVIRTTSYDGAKADIWSCGVILYVMLTGTPPFNYSGQDCDLKHLFRSIALADYVMPNGLSKEAQDLIRRILIPDPKRRISIEGIWNHPFLSKYDVHLGFVGDKATVDHWVGPIPSISDWTKLERNTIDRELLRYLRTLWHSEKEQTLVQRLLSKDANHEKYFYSALLKFRDSYLEDYSPGPDVVGYSTSDHHHCAKSSPQSRKSAPSSWHKHSQSGFSILNDEHLYSKHSFYEPPPSSDASYDPFRASRDPIIPGQSLTHNVTIHRGSGSTGRQRPATALGHRTGSSLRVQAIRNNSQRQSSVASRGSSKYSSPSARSQRSVGVKRRSVSRSSMASSHWPSSPPVLVRPGSIGKRGVSFSHLRRSSACTMGTGSSSPRYTPEQRKFLNRRSRDSVTPSPLSPPPLPSPLANKGSARTPVKPPVARLKIRKPESPSKYIQSEARKVSTELEKVMEEAFNRASIGESIRTSNTDPSKDASDYMTPPTSVSNGDSIGSVLITPSNAKSTPQSRPLPPVPNETPNTYVHRKLAETRADIAFRAAQGGENTAHFNEILAKLDILMDPTVNIAQRASSAPNRSPEQSSLLPAISEEVKSDGDNQYEPYSSPYRAVTDPVRPKLQGRRALTDHPSTIRVVEQSPTRIAPLNIRKRSGASTLSKSANDRLTGWSNPATTRTVQSSQGLHNKSALDEFDERTTASPQPTDSSKAGAAMKKKKSLWFRRNMEAQEETKNKPHVGCLQIPEAWQGLDDRLQKHRPASPIRNVESRHTRGSTSSEFAIRQPGMEPTKNEFGKERKGFLGLFGKKAKEPKAKAPLVLGSDNFSTSSILSDYDLEDGSAASRNRAPEYQMNWLSRFLHIKPASGVLCFQLGRGKVRNDLVRLLRDWQRFGVRDVTFDRQANTINARIDKNNHLRIKPVSFVIELFVVLEQGRRASLCLARFTQIRGAASSFRKVVDVIEDVCRSRTMLVEDEVRKAQMCEVLA